MTEKRKTTAYRAGKNKPVTVISATGVKPKLTKAQKLAIKLEKMTEAQRETFLAERAKRKAENKAKRKAAKAAKEREIALAEKRARDAKARQTSGKKRPQKLPVSRPVLISQLPDINTHAQRKAAAMAKYGLKPDDGSNYNRLWNVAVNDGLDPYQYISDAIKMIETKRKVAIQKRLEEGYTPEIKPASTGRKYRVVNGVVEYYD